MRYFIIAGEASGDLHASKLIEGLIAEDPGAEFVFIGGDLMATAAGQDAFRHFREMNFMGFADVLRNIFTLRKILRQTKLKIKEFSPDAVILVDYAGFNLRIARFASDSGLKVCYYIAPKVWAWRKSRIKLIKKYIDKLYVIFPFEVDFFRQNDVEAEYVGNPLLDMMDAFEKKPVEEKEFLTQHTLDSLPVVALLAGSRRQEINACLPEMVKASGYFCEHQFVVAGAPSVEKSIYEKHLAGTRIKVVYNDTYNLLNNSYAAIVTSGTATLETALLNVPQLVVYKTGRLTYGIGRLFVKFRFFSLVNLIFGDELVKEELQKNLSRKIRSELENLLHKDQYRQQMREGYRKIRELLGGPGASQRVASGIVEFLR